MNTKPILAFDTAGNGASVALWDGTQMYTAAIGAQQQAAELVAVIDDLMRESEIDYGALAAIISTVGPGSFTGVRIGLATLHGLSLARGIPVKLVTTLEAMAWEIGRQHTPALSFTIATRAGKGEVYAQDFAWNGEQPEAISEIYLKPETTIDWPLACYGNHCNASHANYLAGVSAQLLCEIADALPVTTLNQAVPIYIRAPDAVIPKSAAWLMPVCG